MEPWSVNVLIIFAALIGVCIGSFFNVVIYRIPLMYHRLWHQEASDYLNQFPVPPSIPQRFNLLGPASHCPYCQQSLSIWQNIPLLSFILYRGHCRCGQVISWRYPIVELLTAIMTVIAVLQYGLNIILLPALVFNSYLLIMAVMDWEHHLLLDELTLSLLWLGFISNYFGFYTSLESSVWGAIVGYISLWIIAKLFYLATKREGIAYGDFKLLAALGGWLGWKSLPTVVLVACLLGVAVSLVLHSLKKVRLDRPIPFGPYLAAAGWLYLGYERIYGCGFNINC